MEEENLEPDSDSVFSRLKSSILASARAVGKRCPGCGAESWQGPLAEAETGNLGCTRNGVLPDGRAIRMRSGGILLMRARESKSLGTETDLVVLKTGQRGFPNWSILLYTSDRGSEAERSGRSVRLPEPRELPERNGARLRSHWRRTFFSTGRLAPVVQPGRSAPGGRIGRAFRSEKQRGTEVHQKADHGALHPHRRPDGRFRKD